MVQHRRMGLCLSSRVARAMMLLRRVALSQLIAPVCCACAQSPRSESVRVECAGRRTCFAAPFRLI